MTTPYKAQSLFSNLKISDGFSCKWLGLSDGDMLLHEHYIFL